MKFIIILALATATVLLGLEGAAQKKIQKVVYEFPDAMAAPIRKEFAKQCDKGFVLYAINCAHCHMVTINGKEMVPDFTPEQLVGYELRVLNPKHESDLPETTVSAEELGQIMTFLSYKKKNPVAVK